MEQPPNPSEENEHEKALREAKERLALFYAELAKRRAQPSTLRIIIDRYIHDAHERDKQLPDNEE